MLTPLGKKTVTSAGTRVALNSTSIICNTINIQANPANTGNIYVGDVTLVGSTLVGCYQILQPGQSYSIGGSSSNSCDVALVYLDADTSNDNAVVGYVQQ